MNREKLTRRTFITGAAVASGAAFFANAQPTLGFGEEAIEPVDHFVSDYSFPDREPLSGEPGSLSGEIPWPHNGDNNPPLGIFDVPEDDPNYSEYQHIRESLVEYEQSGDVEGEGDFAPLATVGLTPIPRGDAVCRLAFISDTHSGYWGDLAITKLNNALKGFKDIGGTLDAIFLLGDLVCSNTQSEISAVLDKVIKPLPSIFPERTPFHLLMGNHDFLGQWSIGAFETAYGRYLRNYRDPFTAENSTAELTVDYGQKQNATLELCGIPIIKLSPKDYNNNYDFRYLYGFLKEKLAAARAYNGSSGKPILVLAHHPMEGLWFHEYGDCGFFGQGSSEDLVELLSQYPEVVFLAGHLHNPLQLPQSINQDLGFTVIHTATAGGSLWLKEAELEHNKNISQGILLDIYPDNKIKVTRIDFGLKTYIGGTWEFYPEQAATTSAPYLIAPRREAARSVPSTGFSNLSASIQNERLSADFSQGTTFLADENAFIYRYQLQAKNADNGFTVPAAYSYSDFVNAQMAPTFSISALGVANGRWSVSASAINAYDEVVATITKEVTVDRAYKGWVVFPEGRRYYEPSTGRAVTGWKKVDGYWYLFSQSTSLMLTGWQPVNGYWYYLDTGDGHMRTGLQQLQWSGGTDWFCFKGGDSGWMLEGWQKVDGYWYYFTPGYGHAVKGWKKLGGDWYHLIGEEGCRMATGWRKIDGDWYYFLGGDNGRMVKGWQKINGDWYYFLGGDNGRMVKGWQKIDGDWYYFLGGDNGRMVKGWQKIDGSWYYFLGGDNGRMVTGWQKINGDWYYFLGGDNGRMVTDWQKIDGDWYYFLGGNNGRMVKGWQKIYGDWYYFLGGDNGRMVKDWQKIDGKTYYFLGGDNGRMVTGTQTIDGTTYNFASSGEFTG